MTDTKKTDAKPGARNKSFKLRDLNVGKSANVRGGTGTIMTKPGDTQSGITQNTK